MADDGRSRWQRLMTLWRAPEGRLRMLDPGAGGHALVSVLAMIEAERVRWAGTQHTVCTEAELDERFRMRDVLGRGAYGTVHRVIRIDNAEELAVKVIEHSGVDAERTKVIEECRLWQAISSPFHPSVLPLLEVIEVLDVQSIHLITPAMAWGNLAEALADPDVDRSEQSARLMMIQLTSAVAHLHMVHSIAHRDIKPANVLCEGPDPAMAGCLKRMRTRARARPRISLAISFESSRTLSVGGGTSGRAPACAVPLFRTGDAVSEPPSASPLLPPSAPPPAPRLAPPCPPSRLLRPWCGQCATLAAASASRD